MLVLTRKVGESILVGNDVMITLVASQDNKARIGIDAPLSKNIARMELIGDAQHDKSQSDGAEAET